MFALTGVRATACALEGVRQVRDLNILLSPGCNSTNVGVDAMGRTVVSYSCSNTAYAGKPRRVRSISKLKEPGRLKEGPGVPHWVPLTFVREDPKHHGETKTGIAVRYR